MQRLIHKSARQSQKVRHALGEEGGALRRSLATDGEPEHEPSVNATLQRRQDLGGFSWKAARRGEEGDLGCDSVVENGLRVFKFCAQHKQEVGHRAGCSHGMMRDWGGCRTSRHPSVIFVYPLSLIALSCPVPVSDSGPSSKVLLR